MATVDSERGPITLVTLGPRGTCHERATIEYMRFQGVEDFEIVEVQSESIVAMEHLAGRHEAGLAHLEHAVFKGELVGIPSPRLFDIGMAANA
jgi:hypothetical protein